MNGLSGFAQQIKCWIRTANVSFCQKNINNNFWKRGWSKAGIWNGVIQITSFLPYIITEKRNTVDKGRQFRLVVLL